MKPIITTIICLILHLSTSIAQNLSVGKIHTQYLCEDGQAMSWGFDCDGRTGRIGSMNYPGFVNIDEALIKVSAGGYHSLYLDSTGYVWSSGNNSSGQTGTGLNGSNPVKINTIDSIVDITAGEQHSLFLRYDGTVYGCGRNTSHELGDGTNTNRFEPVLIPIPDSVIQISAGSGYSLFVCANGTVYGSGASGATMGLGQNNSYVHTAFPIKVDSLSNIRYANAGERHSLFIDYNGNVFSSGDNSFGQAGVPGNNTYYYPTPVSTLDSIIEVAAFKNQSLFLKADSSVWICGRNTNSYVSEGDFFNSLYTATQISSLEGVTEIGVGQSFLVFEIGDSTLFSLGGNYNGTLGDASYVATFSPVQVTNLCGAPLVFPPNTTGVAEESTNSVGISPNPANHEVHVVVNEGLLFREYELLNINGQIVHSGIVKDEKFTIGVSSLDRGMYFLQFKDGKSTSKKIILN